MPHIIMHTLKVQPTNDELIIAFVQGARWWEHHKTGATMWSEDQKSAEMEASRLLDERKLGKLAPFKK